MSVSYKGKRRIVHNKNEYVWSIKENYDWGYIVKYSVYQELHITAVDKSLIISIPLCFDDADTRNRIKTDLGLTFDVPEAITPSFICQVIDWAMTYQIRRGFTKDIEFLKLGNGHFYTVIRNCKSLLCVEVDDTNNPFDDAVIFEGYLCIGCFEKAFFINVETLEYFDLDTGMYFGYFHEIGNQFYVFTGNGVIAFNRNMELLWRNDDLAIDGVTGGVLSKDGKTLEVSCCMDPYPAVWIDTKISTETGQIL